VLGLVLRELAPAEREWIARRFLERETLAELARAMGVPLSTLHDRERSLLAEIRRRCARLEERDQEAAG
jgi:DNA-directed RNA polymerase specialized sigma24 family protein